MKRKTRAAHLGENYAVLVNYVVSKIPLGKREEYKTRLILELEKYSFTKNVHELEDITKINVEVPEELAKFIKEDANFYYQKDTAKRILTSILTDLRQGNA
jgi:hypothetical protein